ncbi:MAG TPA: ribosome maturation factor RimM [Candidatus Limnocylindrales bacterium]|nr:ribosome maturation factor RimM [Candidatus Limnocylindrales bacterium]
MAEQLVPLGEFVATHGLDGWLRLAPFNPQSETLTPGLEVCLEKSGERSNHEIESSKPHKKQFLIKLRGINHIDSARQHIGATLLVNEAVLAALEPGQYYQYQVIGFQVVDVDGSVIGTVVSTLSTGSGELYVVQGSTKEHLIPAVKEIVEKVDFAEKKMVINPPDGLLDL